MTETAGEKRTRITWSPEERAEWLWLFEQSGKTAAEFCRSNGLSPATLSLWRSQLPEPIDEPAGGLVEVKPILQSPPPAPAPASVPARHTTDGRAVAQLPSGSRIEVPIGADAAWLRELLQTLALLKA